MTKKRKNMVHSKVRRTLSSTGWMHRKGQSEQHSIVYGMDNVLYRISSKMPIPNQFGVKKARIEATQLGLKVV